MFNASLVPIAGIIHEHIDAAKTIFRFSDRSYDVVTLRDVERHGKSLILMSASQVLHAAGIAGRDHSAPTPLQDQLRKDADFVNKNLEDLCASIQQRIITILLNKLKRAAAQTGIKDICIAGGVSANSGLRESLRKTGEALHWRTFIPAFEYCTDNAAMIAMAGLARLKQGDAARDLAIMARAQWPLGSLRAPGIS